MGNFVRKLCRARHHGDESVVRAAKIWTRATHDELQTTQTTSRLLFSATSTKYCEQIYKFPGSNRAI